MILGLPCLLRRVCPNNFGKYSIQMMKEIPEEKVYRENELSRLVSRFCHNLFVYLTLSSLSFCNGLFDLWIWTPPLLQIDKQSSRPRWLSWMRRPTGDQEVAGSTPAEVDILSWRLIMKYFLRSFSPFFWFKKGSCQFLAKECAHYWLTA